MNYRKHGKEPRDSEKRGRVGFSAVIMLILISGALITWRLIEYTTHQINTEMLVRTRMVANALNQEHIKTLTGTMDDIGTLGYQRIKTQLAGVRSSCEECRFLYLMGRKGDGTVFFYADSLPPDSEDYAPPGLVYEEVSDDFLLAFKSGKPMTVGPITDRWGTLMTSLVPIVDPKTGKLLALLGMDVEAAYWKWIVFLRSTPPFALTLALVAVIMLFVFKHRQHVTLSERAAETRATDERARAQREALAALAKDAVMASGEAGAALRKLTERCSAALQCDRVGVWLLSDDGAEMHNIDQWQASRGEHGSGVIQITKNYPEYWKALRRNSLIIADDAKTDPDTIEFGDDLLVPLDITSLLHAAIILNGRLAGVICFEHIGPKRIWQPDEQAFANTSAALAAQIQTNNKRKLAEDALRAGEEQYRRLFDSAGEAIFVTQDGMIKIANPKTEEIFGYSLEKLLSVPFTKFLHPDDRSLVYQRHKKRMENDVSPAAYEFRVINSSREIRWVELKVVVMEWLGKPATLNYLSDITDKKRAEEDLKSQKDRLGFILEGTNVGTWEWNIQTGETIFNQRWADIIGYTLKEISPTSIATWMHYAHPDDLEAGTAALERHVKGDAEYYEIECRIKHKDGRWVWALDRGKVISWTDDGLPLWMYGTHQDITERKLAEESLKQSEHRNRTILRTAMDGFWLIDLQERLMEVNESYCRMSGYSEQELLNMSISDLEADQSPDEIAAHMRKLVENGQERFETRHLRKDGSPFDVEVSVQYLPSEGERAVVFLRDITERRHAEEERSMSMQRTQALLQLNQMTEATLTEVTAFAQDEAVRLTQSKIGYLAFLDDDESVLTMHSWSKSAMEECAMEDTPMHFPVLNTGLWGEAVRQRKPIITNDYPATNPWKKGVPPGHVFLRRHMNAPIFNGDNIVAVIGVGNKETEYNDADVYQVSLLVQGMWRLIERKREEAEREKLQAQLTQSQKMEAIGTLAGGISHDFNNLLQVINGYIQLLLMDRDRNDREYSKLKSIQKAGERAAHLVQQLLFFSRKAETKHLPIDLNHEVEQVRQILERTIPKMIDIDVHVDSGLWIINGDNVQMEQILLNLAKNAADAMPDGGKLTIGTKNIRLEEPYEKTHRGVCPGYYVLLTISDTGHGMDKETVEHIFEPFYTTKDIGKGTGLGLASVYGIVKSHRGHIMCYSEIGMGTTFKIYLPAIEQTDINEPKDTEIKPPRGGNETILLVDDEESIRDFAAQLLMTFGYAVKTASTGEEALDIYANQGSKIHLVVMDLGMPGIGGHKSLQKLLQLDPRVKVLIASGYSINGQVKKSMDAGAAGYLSKPYQLKDLLNKVREVLDDKG